MVIPLQILQSILSIERETLICSWAVFIHVLPRKENRFPFSLAQVILELQIYENPVQKLDAKNVGSGAASERILARFWTLGPSSSSSYNEGNQRFHFFIFVASELTFGCQSEPK